MRSSNTEASLLIATLLSPIIQPLIENLMTSFREVIREEIQNFHKNSLGEKLLTRAEVAEHFGITVQTVTNLTKRGKLLAHHIPGERTIKYKHNEIMEALQHLHKFQPSILYSPN